MKSALPIATGLVAGVVVAIVLIGSLVALVPDQITARSPSPAPSTAAPSAVVSSPPSASAGPSASATPGGIVTSFHIGEAAPALSVPQVGGGTIDLAALKGKPVWVNFMATWCPSCQDEFPVMNGFAARYAKDGLVVIAVDVREEEGKVAAFGQSLNATFPMGLDADGAAQAAWGAYALPVHFWIDAQGIVRDGALGGVGPDLMARGLGRILPGVEVTP